MEINFANPIWLWGLLALLPLVLLRLWSHLRAAKRLPGLVSPRLHRQLITGSSQFQRWLSFSFLALSLGFLLLALARPQWGFEETETESEGRNMLIAIDTSRSMLATDLLPNRMLRAKLAAKDILTALPEDRIGLIAFAGRAFLQAPLTVDHDAVAEAIDQLDTDIIPRGGTNLTAAAKIALEAFKESQLEESALVIFSDGEALEGVDEIESIKTEAKTAGMTIITVGVGSSGGSIIPEIDSKTGNQIPGVFIKDETGQVVRTRLDEGALRALASGSGAYIHLGNSSSISAVVERITATIATSRKEEQAQSRPIERFMWLLSIATALMILTFLTPLMFLRRRKPESLIAKPAMATSSLAIGLILFGAIHSSSADSMKEGFDAFERGAYDEAISIYRKLEAGGLSSSKEPKLQLSLGAAAFQKGDYESAEQAFAKTLISESERLQEIAHYNLGNTLFRKGETYLKAASEDASTNQLQPMTNSASPVESTLRQWEGAIEHFESALAQNEDNDKARFNIEVVKKRIEELKKEQEEQEQEEQNQDQEEEDEEKKDEEEKKDDQEKQDGDQDQKEDQEQDQEQDSESGKDGENQENKDDQEKKDSEDQKDESGDQEDKEKEKQEPQDSQNGEEEQNEPETPEDGKLEANPNQEQQAPPPSQQNQAQQMQRNPDTGYTPSEARQLLRALADETEVRPIMKPAKPEKYKNW